MFVPALYPAVIGAKTPFFDPTSITINGTTKQPLLLLTGDQAAVPWPARESGDSYAAGGTGTAATVNSDAAPPHPWLRHGITFSEGGHLVDTSCSVAISTVDFVVECYCEYPNNDGLIVWSMVGTGGTAFELQTTGTGKDFRMVLDDGPTLKVCDSVGTLVSGTAYMIHVIGDRSGSMRIYVDGANVGTTDISAATGDPTNDTTLAIGARANDTLKYDGNFHYLGVWGGGGADWLDTHDQAAWVSARLDAWGL